MCGLIKRDGVNTMKKKIDLNRKISNKFLTKRLYYKKFKFQIQKILREKTLKKKTEMT